MATLVQKIPFLRLVVALAAGIIFGEYISLRPFVLILMLFALTALLIVVNQNFSFRLNSIFGIGVHIVFTGIGITLYSLYNQKPVFYNQGKFYAEVLEILQEKPNSYQSVLRITTVFSVDSVFKTDEKVMVYFEKTERAQKLQPGEVILFQQRPQLVRNNNNPYEFDYAGYLARKKIYRQVYLPENNWKKTSAQARFSFFILAEKTRSRLLEIYRKQNLNENEFHILSALSLGYKRGLDPEIKRTFSSAGAMHVLAVSGLHVGIVFIVLSLMFGFLRKQKAGRSIFILIVLLALWSFAFITGLSPSVQRAATMFSFLVIGENTKRRPSTYNSLAASAFLLLLINPNNLFEAGFQLSYSAVFGIVFLQPKLVKIFQFKNKILQYGWALLTVSVAAQIATFPVTAFYFNQFPSYFWLSNLLVIPAVTLLIPLGLGLLVFHWIPIISEILVFTVTWILRIVILFLEFVEELPFSVAEFTLPAGGLVFLSIALLSVFLFIETRQKKYFKGILFSLLLLTGTSFVLETVNIFRKEIIIYNQPDNVVVHLINGKRNYVVSEEKWTDSEFARNTITNTVRKLNLKEPVFLDLKQKYHDKFIYLRHGLIAFGGKIIAYKVHKSEIPEELRPEILIDPFPGEINEDSIFSNTVIISSLQYSQGFMDKNINVFHLRHKGAFRKKW
ncbi:MAG: ComEC/Rec2 family competence protein [Mariniphaga sp.]